MIGQTALVNKFTEIIENGLLSRFVIISGDVGSGKKTLANYIAQLLKADATITVETKMESIHEMIQTAQTTSNKLVFIVPDANTMSVSTANALLKIVEEPPATVYFIMTTTSTAEIMGTLISRAQIFNMLPYSSLDIIRYTKSVKEGIDDETLKIITDICETPGEVNQLLTTDVTAFYNYASKVVDTIATVSGANSFKIADKLNLKDDGDKYDLTLFLKAFINICMHKSADDYAHYLKAIPVTVDALCDLKKSGANKQMIIDTWILGIRKEWLT